MKVLYISLFITLLMSCFGKGTKQPIEVFPLHPYSASPTDYDPSTNKQNTFIEKYFFVDGAKSLGSNLADTINIFVRQYLESNRTDFEMYGGYSMYFFRKTDQLNSNYRNRGTDDTPSSHIEEDLLLKYEWSDQKFDSCSVYKNGELIKAVFISNEILFKK